MSAGMKKLDTSRAIKKELIAKAATTNKTENDFCDDGEGILLARRLRATVNVNIAVIN